MYPEGWMVLLLLAHAEMVAMAGIKYLNRKDITDLHVQNYLPT